MRHAFGPAPGRVWVSLDYENIELRIPAYDSGERCMIDLFEKPDEPPFFGSYHLLNASIIYPDLFWPLAEQKGAFKARYRNTYTDCKSVGFGFQYGAGRDKIDRTARRKGSYDKIKDRLKEHTRLTNYWIEFANNHGYIETIPDKTVDPKRGYPIVCVRGEHGRVSPTLPLAYRVQSTAMWCTSKAMVRCTNQLQEWSQDEGREYWIALQVHDELVFDMPGQHKGELIRKVNTLRALMEESGSDIGVPLKVSANLHEKSWGEGVTVTQAV
jgi:DNA polymerase I-like protein with 3'-5' exonuclease and polymerase domains